MHILTINNDKYGFLYIDQLVKYLCRFTKVF